MYTLYRLTSPTNILIVSMVTWMIPPGGSTPIHNYINNLTSNDIQSLCNKHILFIDQVVLSDGYYLLTWDEVKEKHSSKYSGPIPKWFLRLEQDFTLIEHPINEWVYYWDNTKRDIVLGKTISRENDFSSSITYFQYYIPVLYSSCSSSYSSVRDPVTPT
ncbi:hypothetical protein RCL_jg7043.t1 [Rhizophagus clarus]|uniref:Uncharacterized protein n=1 Tax=Rhizophagus clarus TaxID=94130 RepID=A0A8H3M358_9GLOM|nr:hypothetical protein RCL_jg7043.t1 [Rhizophagus clarus]